MPRKSVVIESTQAPSYSVTYSRTLYVWTKTDDKKLLKGIAAGSNVLELAEELEREHMSILRRLHELDLFNFEPGTEEWVEVMSLAIGGVALQVVLDWCNATPERLPYDEIQGMLMADCRPEFEMARELHIELANIDALTAMSWLVAQPEAVQAGYPSAIDAVYRRFDMPTPLAVKNQVLGIVPAVPMRAWKPIPTPKKTSYSRTRTYSKPRRSTTGYSKGYSKSRRSYSRKAKSSPRLFAS